MVSPLEIEMPRTRTQAFEYLDNYGELIKAAFEEQNNKMKLLFLFAAYWTVLKYSEEFDLLQREELQEHHNYLEIHALIAQQFNSEYAAYYLTRDYPDFAILAMWGTLPAKRKKRKIRKSL